MQLIWGIYKAALVGGLSFGRNLLADARTVVIAKVAVATAEFNQFADAEFQLPRHVTLVS